MRTDSNSNSQDSIPRDFLKACQFMEKYPLTLKKYVSECFSKCKNKQDSDEVSSLLKEKINRIAMQQVLSTFSWEKEPIISLSKPEKDSFPNRPKEYMPNKNYERKQYEENIDRWKRDYPSRTPSNPLPVSKQIRSNYQESVSQDYDEKKYNRSKRETQYPEEHYQQKINRSNSVNTYSESSYISSQSSQVIDIRKYFKDSLNSKSSELFENRIVGTYTTLEKPYLRTTSIPDPSTVRPLHILKQSLDFIISNYVNNKNYEYISEQLRSMRQDLTVQHIEDEFCVKVYETHCQLALENNDWDNFNQVQHQLESLLLKGFGSDESFEDISCYRIIYFAQNKDITGLYSFIPKIPENVLSSSMVQFSLRVWQAVSCVDLLGYIELMRNAPKLSNYIMLRSLNNLRKESLNRICNLRSIKLSDFSELLGFENNFETKEFLKENNIQVLDC